MTMDPVTAQARPLTPLLAVLAALALGAAAMTGIAAVDEDGLRMLLAGVVCVVGLAVFTAARKPGAFGAPVLRGAGSGLVVLGVHLLANSLFLAMDVGRDGGPELFVMVLYGLPALAVLLLAASGMRVWLAATGVLVLAVVTTVVQLMAESRTVMGVPMLVVAVVLTVVVVAAPAGAGWGDLAGAGAAIAANYAVGAGTSIIGAFVLQQVPIADAAGRAPKLSDGLQAVCVCGAVLVAVVLLMVATVRRDPATGLLAAAVVVLSDATEGHPFVWIPLVVLVLAVALVGLRVPAVRSALAAVPAALREHRPSGATTAAACAAVAGTALVLFGWKGLPDLGVDGWPAGVLTAAVLLVAGALAYFLPGAAGAALAVVALVALFLTRPWAHLLDAGSVVLGLVELATAVGAVWALGKRHARPAVWAAAAYLMLGTLPDVLAPLLGLTGEPTPASGARVVVLLLPLVLVGLPAAVLAWRGPSIANWQAVGAVVLGSTLMLSVKLTLAIVLGGDLGARGPAEPINPLTPTDVLGSAFLLDLNAVKVVAVTVIALAVVSVLSVARRPATPLAVAAALAVFVMVPYAVGRIRGGDVDLSVLAWGLVAVAVVLAAVAVGTARHGSRDQLVHEA